MKTNHLPVNVVSYKITNTNSRIFYPQITGLGNTVIQSKINQALSHQTHALIQKQDYNEHPQLTQMQGSYELKSNERGILSILQTNYAYTEHFAHGMTYTASQTFDVDTGKQYSLSELFKSGTSYREKLSEMVRKQIKQRDIPTLGDFTVIKSNQDYYVADKVLVLYFQLYEITPYYVGFPMFPISVYDILDLAKEHGPLSVVAADI